MTTALESMERIYGFLMAKKSGYPLIQEYKNACAGLATIRDYHQVVSKLASAAAQLVELGPGPGRTRAAQDVLDCVNRLQNVTTEP